jgi:hypothetical protein
METELNMHPFGMLSHGADYMPFLSRYVIDLLLTEYVMILTRDGPFSTTSIGRRDDFVQFSAFSAFDFLTVRPRADLVRFIVL